MNSSFQTPQAPPADSLVCIVDDEELVRRSLARLLRSIGVTVETFVSAGAYLDRSPHRGPGCLVLDVRMPELDGLELQQRLRDRGTQIIFISGHGDVPTCAQAMKAGAVDFLTKPVEADDLIESVHRALQRSLGAQKSAEVRRIALQRIDTLTAREREVLQHVIAGLLNKQIADLLGAAEKTIKIHRGRVMEKMGVTSVAELVRFAHAADLPPIALATPP